MANSEEAEEYMYPENYVSPTENVGNHQSNTMAERNTYQDLRTTSLVHDDEPPPLPDRGERDFIRTPGNGHKNQDHNSAETVNSHENFAAADFSYEPEDYISVLPNNNLEIYDDIVTENKGRVDAKRKKNEIPLEKIYKAKNSTTVESHKEEQIVFRNCSRSIFLATLLAFVIAIAALLVALLYDKSNSIEPVCHCTSEILQLNEKIKQLNNTINVLDKKVSELSAITEILSLSTVTPSPPFSTFTPSLPFSTVAPSPPLSTGAPTVNVTTKVIGN